MPGAHHRVHAPHVPARRGRPPGRAPSAAHPSIPRPARGRAPRRRRQAHARRRRSSGAIWRDELAGQARPGPGRAAAAAIQRDDRAASAGARRLRPGLLGHPRRRARRRVHLADARRRAHQVFAAGDRGSVFHATLERLPMLQAVTCEKSWKTNVLGTLDVASGRGGADVEHFIDSIFETKEQRRPTRLSVLGTDHKRLAERAPRPTPPRAAARSRLVRFGDVFGSRARCPSPCSRSASIAARSPRRRSAARRHPYFI